MTPASSAAEAPGPRGRPAGAAEPAVLPCSPMRSGARWDRGRPHRAPPPSGVAGGGEASSRSSRTAGGAAFRAGDQRAGTARTHTWSSVR